MRAAILTLCFVMLSLAAPARAAELPFKVVVHPDVPVSTVSKATLAQLFLRTRSRWDGGDKVKPVDQPAGSALRAAFSRLVLDRDMDAVKSYWDQQVFSGKGVPPPEKAGDAAVVAYVAATPGAVGYIDAATRVEGLKVLTVTEVASDK